MKVLIVKLSALGDVVHALPVLSHLHAADPEVEIDWLVEESFAPLLNGHPLLREVLPAATKRWRKEGVGAFLRGVRELSATLRSKRYDMVLDLQGNSKSGLFTWLSRAPSRYGFAKDGAREWPNLLATHHHVPLAGAHHVTERSLAIARKAMHAQVEVPLAGPLPVCKTEQDSVRKSLEPTLSGRALVVCHFGTTWKTKLWPVENWQELLERLAAQGRRLLLTWGDQAEKEIVDGLAERVPDAQVWPRGSLKGLVALLAEADLVIGGDTGPVHLAAAVDTATVSWYRVTDARRNGPRGERHILLQSPLDCSPCLRKECERDKECGKSISVEQVVEAADALLSGAAHE